MLTRISWLAEEFLCHLISFSPSPLDARPGRYLSSLPYLVAHPDLKLAALEAPSARCASYPSIAGGVRYGDPEQSQGSRHSDGGVRGVLLAVAIPLAVVSVKQRRANLRQQATAISRSLMAGD